MPFLSRVTRHRITTPCGAGQNINNSMFSVGSGILTVPLGHDTSYNTFDSCYHTAVEVWPSGNGVCCIHNVTLHSVQSLLYYQATSQYYVRRCGLPLNGGPHTPWEGEVLRGKGHPFVKYRDTLRSSAQKRLNWSRCRLSCGLRFAQGTMY